MGEALQDTDHQKTHRGPNADLLIGGHDSDDRGGDGHHDDGHHKYGFSAALICYAAEDDSSEWTHQETNGKNAEGS